jgi:hypothetical protein
MTMLEEDNAGVKMQEYSFNPKIAQNPTKPK